MEIGQYLRDVRAERENRVVEQTAIKAEIQEGRRGDPHPTSPSVHTGYRLVRVTFPTGESGVFGMMTRERVPRGAFQPSIGIGWGG